MLVKVVGTLNTNLLSSKASRFVPLSLLIVSVFIPSSCIDAFSNVISSGKSIPCCPDAVSIETVFPIAR